MVSRGSVIRAKAGLELKQSRRVSFSDRDHRDSVVRKRDSRLSLFTQVNWGAAVQVSAVLVQDMDDRSGVERINAYLDGEDALGHESRLILRGRLDREGERARLSRMAEPELAVRSLDEVSTLLTELDDGVGPVPLAVHTVGIFEHPVVPDRMIPRAKRGRA